MKKNIVITTRFPAVHNWPDCNSAPVDFLQYPHRHLFHVTVKWRVAGVNRELEFLTKKEEVEQFINEKYWNENLGGMSCEMIAEAFLKEFGAQFVSIYEDGENGAEVYND
jgi:hypothetical protein